MPGGKKVHPEGEAYAADAKPRKKVEVAHCPEELGGVRPANDALGLQLDAPSVQ